MSLDPENTPGGLHHVELYVSNLERSRVFWSWFLDLMGYELYQEWPEGFSYLKDSSYLVFVQTEAKYLQPEYHRCRTGLNHLAFWAKSRAQIDEITRQLKEQGAVILYPERHPYAGGEGYYALFFEDPDRIKVELVAP